MVACTGASTCGSRRCSPAFRALFCLLRPAVVARGGVRGSACSAFRRPCFIVPWPAVVAKGEVQGVLGFSATAPAKRRSCSVQGCWKLGGCGEDAPWPCVFSGFGSVACGGRLLRLATRVGCSLSRVWRRPGVFLSGVLHGVGVLHQVLRWFSGAVAAVVLGFSALFFCICSCSVCNLC